MRVEALTLKDFKSYQDADIDFSGIQLASVVGANGAGKSSLLEAIAFALTGAKGMRNLDAFIRQGCEECRVALTFSTGGETYRLTRTRSNRGKGTSTVELVRHDVSDLWTPECTGATAADERVRELLGVDEETLLQTAIVSQGDAGSFFALRPAQRLEALGSILRLDETYGPLERHFKAQGDTAKGNLETARRDVERLEADVERLELKREELADAQIDVDRAYGDLRCDEEALEEARTALRGVSARAADYELAVAKRDEVLKRKNALEERLGRLTDEHDELVRRVSRRETLEADLARRADLDRELERELRHREADQAVDTDRRRLEQAVTTARGYLDEVTEEYRQAERREAAATADMQAAEAAHIRERQATDELGARLQGIAESATPVCDRCGQEIANAALAVTLAGIRQEWEAAGERTLSAAEMVTHRQEQLAEAAQGRQDARDRGQERRRGLDAAQAELNALPAPAHSPAHLVTLEGRIRGLANIPEQLAAIAAMEERLAAVQAESGSVQRQLDDPALVDDLVDTEGAVREAQGARGRATDAEAKVQQAEAALAGSRQLLSDAEKVAARLEGEVASLAPSRDALAETQAAAKTHEQEQADAELLRKAMGKWGIPALIVGNVLLSLEVEVNELLSLYEGSLALRFESERETRDGARDSLEIMCFDGEVYRPLESFSGGEQYRFASAIRLGLAILLSHRSGSRVETLLLDEPEGLDAEGRGHLVNILQKMSAHFGLVMVFSHYPDLQEAMPSQLRVARGEDGLSRVEVVA